MIFAGPVGILVCFLDILDIFNKKDPYYLQNQLYIEQYCVWIQQVSPDSPTIATIVQALEKVSMNCLFYYYLRYYCDDNIDKSGMLYLF